MGTCRITPALSPSLATLRRDIGSDSNRAATATKETMVKTSESPPRRSYSRRNLMTARQVLISEVT